MTEKRFEYDKDTCCFLDHNEWGIKGKSIEEIEKLLNDLHEENIRLKKEKKSKRKPKYIHQHIIRITYPYQTDVEDTEYMIKHIKSVITKETGVEPTIEEYLL